MYRWFLRRVALLTTSLLLTAASTAGTGDLYQVKRDVVLRHLGIPNANFMTGAGDGLDVELIRSFARSLGVCYGFVETDWSQAFGDLNGRHAHRAGDSAERFSSTPIRGDLIANGMSILGWRGQIVDFRLVDNYYPNVFDFFPGFFDEGRSTGYKA